MKTKNRSLLLSNISETCLLNPVSAGKSILMLSVLMTVKWQGLPGAMRQIQTEGSLMRDPRLTSRVTSLEITVQNKRKTAYGIHTDSFNAADPQH